MKRIYYFLKAFCINLFRRTTKVSLSARIKKINKQTHYVKIGSKSYVNGTIGRCSYIGEGCVIYGAVGSYCSISNNVRIITGTHPMNYISTSPVFYSNKKQCGLSLSKNPVFCDELKREDNTFCSIGNDVWIGENVLIKGGVSIGDGAVIGMGAVVVSDVPPYSIVGGCPAKVIKYRFSEDIIIKLLKLKWWDFDLERIKLLKEEFLDVNSFLKDNSDD